MVMTRKDFKVCAAICASLIEYQQIDWEVHVLNVFVCELNMMYDNFDSDKFERYIKSLIH